MFIRELRYGVASSAKRFIAAVATGSVIALIGILLCFTRFYNLYLRTSWYDDSGRDVMVAKKISETGRFQPIVPRAGKGMNILENSYLYFNWLAVLWSISGDEKGMILIYTVINSASLVLGYWIGKEIAGKWVGMMTVLSLVLSPWLAQATISIFQRNALPAFSLVAIFIAQKAVKHSSLRWLLVLHFVMVVAVLTNYAFLTFSVAIVGITIWVLMRNSSSLWLKFIAIASSLLGNSLFFFVLSKSTLADIILYLQTLVVYWNWGGHQTMTINSLYGFNYLFPDADITGFSYLIFVTICLASIIWLIKDRGKSSQLSVVLLFLLSTACVPLVIEAPYMSHHAIVGSIIVPIVIGLLVATYVPKMMAVYVVLFIVFSIWGSKKFLIDTYYITPKMSEMVGASMIADITVRDYINDTHDQRLNSYLILDFTKPGGVYWFGPSLLYFVEKETGLTFTTLSNEKNNISYSIPQKPTHLYLVCNKWKWDNQGDVDVDYIQRVCMQKFLENSASQIFGTDAASLSTTLLIRPEENGLNATVYRIKKK